MSTWIFEPGHTEAEFRARHMMVTWVGDENKGELRRIGFEGAARIDRHDFGVSWQDAIPGGGVVVSNEIELALDVEAIALEDLERTGAIEYYADHAVATVPFIELPTLGTTPVSDPRGLEPTFRRNRAIR